MSALLLRAQAGAHGQDAVHVGEQASHEPLSGETYRDVLVAPTALLSHFVPQGGSGAAWRLRSVAAFTALLIWALAAAGLQSALLSRAG